MKMNRIKEVLQEKGLLQVSVKDLIVDNKTK